MNPELIRLIESNEIQIHGDVEYFVELIAAAEREACAKVCEAEAEKWEGDDGPICYEARLCAVNIRARGEK